MIAVILSIDFDTYPTIDYMGRWTDGHVTILLTRGALRGEVRHATLVGPLQKPTFNTEV